VDHNVEPEGLPGSGNKSKLRRLLQTINARDFHIWIQTSALIIAGAWGIYTFIWRDILVPSWAPAHINISLILTRNQPSTGNKNTTGSESVTLTIKADNPSGRKLYLLRNVWQLYGSKHQPRQTNTFHKDADGVLRAPALGHAERHANQQTSPLLAIGRVFDEDMIQPGESISRSVVLQIPNGFDAVNIAVILPALTIQPNARFLGGQSLQWGVNNNDEIFPLLCRDSGSQQGESAGGQLNQCQIADAMQIQDLIKSYDSRVQIFTKNEQLPIPELNG